MTRSISLRTCERKVRPRPHQPNTPFGLIAVSLARSSIADFTLHPLSDFRLYATPFKTTNWQARRDSNPQPPVLETGALPVELLAFVSLLRLSMRRVPAAPPTIFLHLKTIGHFSLVLRCVVVTSLTLSAGEDDDVAHSWKSFISVLCRWKESYSMISVMVPEPTVRPPSRMANRRPFSNATGVISSTLIDTLSPGITISTPSGRFATPVTSVVRR